MHELTRHEIGETLFEKLKERYAAKEQIIGEKPMRFHERMIMLSVLDGLWKDHLLNMDHLKEGIGLRGYAQQDPLVAYKKESFDMFEGMMGRFQEDTVRYLFLMQIVGPDGQPVAIPSRPRPEIPAAPPVASADGHRQAAPNGHRTPPPALPGARCLRPRPVRQSMRSSASFSARSSASCSMHEWQAVARSHARLHSVEVEIKWVAMIRVPADQEEVQEVSWGGRSLGSPFFLFGKCAREMRSHARFVLAGTCV